MDLLDAVIRRDNDLQRFATHIYSSIVLPATKKIAIEAPKITADIPGATKAEYKAKQREFTKFVGAVYADMWGDVNAEYKAMTGDELEYTGELYEDFSGEEFNIPPTDRVFATARNSVIVLTSNKVDSGLWEDFLKQNTLSAQKAVAGIIAQGWRDGMTSQQMTKALRGTYNRQTKKYQGGIIDGTLERHAKTIVRTGVSHFSNRSRDAFALENSNVILSKIFFATLDNRTTQICLSLHQNEYKIKDKKAPELPIHYNERSVYVFKTPSLDPRNLTRPVTSGRKGKAAADRFDAKQERTDRKVKYKGRKDSDIFDVQEISGKVTAEQWLRRQPDWFIESSLGSKTKARLFKEGGLPIKSMVDLQHRPLTLAELRDTADGEAAFRRAGL